MDGEYRGDDEDRGDDGETVHTPPDGAEAEVATTDLDLEPGEPAEVRAWAEDDESETDETLEEEEIDLVAIRAAWEEFRAKWDESEREVATGEGDSEDAPSAAGSASPEDGESPETWTDDDEYELVEAGAAAGSIEVLTEAVAPLDWADHEEWNDAVSSVHTEFAATAEDGAADVGRVEDHPAEFGGVEEHPIDVFEPEPVGGSDAPAAWSLDEPSDDAAVAMEAPIEPADEHHGDVIAAASAAVADDVDDGDDGDEESEGRRPHTSARTARRSGETRRRVLLAALFVAVVICAVVVVHAGRARSETQPPAAIISPVSSGAQLSRVESAISDVQSASSAAQAGLTSLAEFPTPQRVAAVVNPYVDSLQLYQNVAAGVTVPTSARSAFASANDQVVQDITFLKSINGLPPVQLGSFIEEFFAHITQLQATLDRLQQDLQPKAH